MKHLKPAVEKFSEKSGLTVHKVWPIEVPKGEFDIGVVASFGRLIPNPIISAFPM